MAETFEFNGCLYSITPPSHELDDVSYEEIMAARNGGDPVEWIPEAELEKAKIAESIETGKPLVEMNPDPVCEGVFEGMHEIRILNVESQIYAGPMVVRHVFATPEQFQSGHFNIPREGYFVK